MNYHKISIAMKPSQDTECYKPPEIPPPHSLLHTVREPLQKSTLALPSFELYMNGIILYAL